MRNNEVWVKTTSVHADPASHWRQRLDDGLAHDISLVIAKAVQGQLGAGVPKADVVRQVARFGAQNRDGWGVGLTILTALGNLLPALPEEEAYLALFHGARRVAADCDGQAPRKERAPLGSRPEPAILKRWLRRRMLRQRAQGEERSSTAMTDDPLDALKARWNHIQGYLFPWLREEVDPMTEALGRLVTAV